MLDMDSEKILQILQQHGCLGMKRRTNDPITCVQKFFVVHKIKYARKTDSRDKDVYKDSDRDGSNALDIL
ncbi:hypothetical protein KIN20_004512 [Parelaphostrongylus tenuis]|uniref:Uncharacterized protein n=1 Tax=Parelaphostrongylus tenuis TaxID=148309 RepID=A0AAD5M381_PARTN|nr:hypothetical protein KIN20_004512 [Parelaphostrongylus tenuis]